MASNPGISPDVSKDLVNDLDKALGGDFSFKGKFYYASQQPTAPNPCLAIEGLGIIGLPLNEREAKAIIASSKQAPFGKGKKTLVDKTIRNTWEIESDKVTFSNPKWTTWLEATVFKTVWDSLGVAPYTTRPRCELYKLLVYEKGSHTQKADGMFATVIVVLPSAFEGGEVILSHSGATETVDITANSAMETSILAWYTDVMHEVRPITSGYRLALSYNLIHTSPNVPRPVLPDMSDAAKRLQAVLRGWKEEKYPQSAMPSPPFFAYVLSHQYSGLNLSSGTQGLKGADAHKAAHLLPIAKELGFSVAFAALEYTVTGTSSSGGGGCGYGYRKRRRYGYWGMDDEDEDDGEMDEVIDASYTLSKVTDSEGNQFPGVYTLDEGALIPKDPFRDATPDDKESEGYMGNYGGEVNHWYRRTVMILFESKNEMQVMSKLSGGLLWGVSKLQSTTARPSSEEKAYAAFLLQSMVTQPERTYYGSSKPSEDSVRVKVALLECAVKWKDASLWSQVVAKWDYSFEAIGLDSVLAAFGKFTFDSIKQCLDEMVKRASKLDDRLKIVNSIAQKAGKKPKVAVKKWIDEQSSSSIASYNTGDVTDIPILISVAKSRGLQTLNDTVVLNISGKPKMFDFWMGFADALHEARGEISAEPASIDALIKKCLEEGAPQWTQAEPKGINGQPYENRQAGAQVHRAIKVVEIGLKTKITQPGIAILNEILKGAVPSDKTPDQFTWVYAPLIIGLKETLKKFNMDFSTPPFSDLVRYLVRFYLSAVLGGKPATGVINLRKVGCGCQQCQQIDQFIMDSSSARSNIQFKAHLSVRSHLESRIARAPDLFTYQTIRYGSPHTLSIDKSPAIVALAKWEAKVKAAKVFLAGVGNEEMLKTLLGPQDWQNAVGALSGVRAFSGFVPVRGGAGAGTSGSVSGAPATLVGQGAAGVKRKQPGGT
ncbi:hypothetical protein CC1G_09674 [Coprinopsis cinerea okayama7|uniref:Prolyl 4-hydroxylase alpha subunit Fe(2+) 2OG dioxygenase domain-containing protein n=1 Tax=Coprinopsis cinerea (strain Okayama-7 / 130 / ATCC MYA-4618 / FGSC 9003) TaxID=240176 RepID=A8P9H2_COPC7|nr:hypothetical protein CC1G_09674 [Coprinopsis cinerea okayama7\|eukprot:XP_001839771.2 hypothetical protein CC1G_09674 [Coprinopsis cinerea okayama7\